MKYFSLILVFLAMFSCSQQAQNDQVQNLPATEEHEAENTVAVSNHPPAETNGLRLNNGKKWPADDATRTAFNSMENTVLLFTENKQQPDLSDYNWLGKTLQSDLNILFNSCKMEGEAHDQLHALLELVIADVKSLQTREKTEAAKGYNNIPQHLQLFHEYFE